MRSGGDQNRKEYLKSGRKWPDFLQGWTSVVDGGKRSGGTRQYNIWVLGLKHRVYQSMGKVSKTTGESPHTGELPSGTMTSHVDPTSVPTNSRPHSEFYHSITEGPKFWCRCTDTGTYHIPPGTPVLLFTPGARMLEGTRKRGPGR